MKSSILTVTLLVALSSFIVLTDAESSEADSSDYSGSCGENATFELDAATGKLTISGSGPVSDSWAPGYSAYSSSITSIEIGESITYIKNDTFVRLTSLQSIDVCEANANYSSADGVLFNKDKTVLINYPDCKADYTYIIPNSVKSVECNAFSNNTELSTLYFSNSVETIDSFAFQGCTSLTSIHLSDSVSSIGYSAFMGCIKLSTVLIPESVTSIGEGAFVDCDSLRSINVDVNNPDYSSDGGVLFNKDKTVLIQYPNGRPDPDYEIPNKVETIGPQAFHNTRLTSISIPDSVNSIKYFAFSDNTDLNELIVPVNLDCVGQNNYPVFNGCVNIQKITFTGTGNWYPYGISDSQSSYTQYTPWQFSKSALTTVIIRDGVTSIGNFAFKDCTSLTSVILSDSVRSIGDYSFLNCSSITTLDIPYSVTEIGYSAFSDCTSLSTVSLSGSVTSLGDYAFKNCTSLVSFDVSEKNSGYCSVGGVLFSKDKSILIQYPAGRSDSSYQIPDTVVSIRSNAFYCCTMLASIIILDSVTSVEESAFKGCSGLKELAIPANLDSVRSNGHPIFEGCVNIEKITFTGSGNWYAYGLDKTQPSYFGYTPWQLSKTVLTAVIISDSVTSVEGSAFKGCSGLNELSIPATLDSVGSNKNPIFEGCTHIEKITFTGSGNWYAYGLDKTQPSYFGYTPWQFSRSALTAVIVSEGITYIGDRLFENCTAIDTVSISDSVTAIGEFAFGHCSALLSLSLPDTLTAIGDSAFKDCTSLKELTISATLDSVGSNKNPIFEGCTHLEKVTFTGTGNWYSYGPDENKSSYYGYTPWQFSRSALTTVIVSEGVASVGDYAFQDCIKLDSLTISGSVTAIGSVSFYNCASLAVLTIPDSVTSIGYSAFTLCSSINSLTIPESVSFIGTHAFRGCTSLCSVTIPDSIVSLEDSVFRDCTSLISITIPDSVTSIGDSVFRGCTSLTSIAIPDTVESVESNIFDGCSALESINVGENNKNYSSSDGVLLNRDMTVLIRYPIGKTGSAYEIPNTVTSLGTGAFSGCQTLQSVTIPDSVTSIGDYVFRNAGLVSVLIPDSVNYLGTGAFSSCASLEKAIVSGTMAAIGEKSFSGCHVLATVILPGSVTSIESHAFDGCTSLATITLPDSLRSIGNSAFLGCTLLDSIILPESVETIEAYAFDGCTNLKSLVIPDSITSVESHAFDGCTSLATITLPDSLRSIGNSAFLGCTLLDSIILPESVETIEAYAFDGCTNLKSVLLPDSVKYIGASAFGHCTSLTSVSIGCYLESIGDHAFDGKFYDIYGKKELEPTVLSLTRSTFENIGGKWIKQTSSPSIKDPNKSEIAYEFDAGTGTLVIHGYGQMGDYFEYSVPSDVGRDSVRSVIIRGAVTSIGNFAFYRCESLTAVSLPDSTTSIGDYAFYGCTSLSSISFPASVRTIGDCAFEGCTSIESVTIPDSVTTVRGSAFRNCSNLASVILSDSLTSIGNSVFEGCTSLTSIISPDSVTSIGDNAFGGCTNLHTIALSKNIKSIGNRAFEGCISLASITLPDSFTSIGDFAFSYCPSLASISIPYSVSFIGAGAFDGKFYENKTELEQTAANLAGFTFLHHGGKWIKQNDVGICGEYVTYELDFSTRTLTISGSGQMESYPNGKAPWFLHRDYVRSVVISDSVTSIGDHAFEGITAIDTVAIPDSVETVGEYAFEGCSNLAAVNIGRSVSLIGKTAFIGCSSLASYAVSADNGVYTSTDGVLFSKDMTVLIQYPEAKADASYAIPGTVKTIVSSAFRNCTSLISITVPKSVETVETGAFDMIFYDPAGENVLDQTVENMAGSTFNCVESKWIKGESSEEDPVESIMCGNDVSYAFDENSGTLTISGTGPMFDYSVDSTPWYPYRDSITSVSIEGSVTSIGTGAFYNCTFLTSVIIPESVTTIGISAFDNCASLASITLSDSVTTIGDYAFDNCNSLASVTIPEFVTAVGNYTFSGCNSLTSIVIPNSVKFIGNCAFENCTSLESVLIKNSVTSIRNFAFCGCSSLTFVYIPQSVDSIGLFAFDKCTSLTSISIPDSVTTIGEGAFVGTFYNLGGETELEPTAQNLAGYRYKNIDGRWIRQTFSDDDPSIESGKCGEGLSYVFDATAGTLTIRGTGPMDTYSAGGAPWYSHKDAITFIDISDSVTTIGDYAFEGCSSVSHMIIPDSVSSVGSFAFAGCASVASVYIGRSAESIGDSAFSGCDSLTSFVVSDENAVYCSIGGILFSIDMTTLFIYPAGKADTAFEIPKTVTTIGSYAFDGSISLTSITVPESVKFIGENAFSSKFYETDTKTEIIPTANNLAGSTFDHIGDKWIKFAYGTCGTDIRYSFDNRTGTLVISGSGPMPFMLFNSQPWVSYRSLITSVEIENTITSIGEQAFYGCDSLTSVTFSDTIQSIGYRAFCECTGLVSITLPDSVTFIGESAFDGCNSLTSVFLPNSVRTLSNKAFTWCSSITSVTIPDSVTFIGASAFEGCRSLASVTIPDSVTSIGASAFGSCYALTSVTIPDSVTSIGASAFEGCGSLASVTIPDSVTSIGASAFGSCYALTSVTIPDSVTSLGASAFSGCKALRELVVPAGLDTVVSSQDPAFGRDPFIEKVTFTGTGKLFEYNATNYKFTPWHISESTRTIIISDGVTSIEGYAFHNCVRLKELTVPANIDCVGPTGVPIFYGCTNIVKITFVGNGDWFGYGANATKYTPWSLSRSVLTSAIFSEGITSIGGHAFEGCTSLSSITIPDSVETVEEDAFDCVFFDTDGKTVLDQTAENLAGSTFDKVDGIIIKQVPTPPAEPDKLTGECGENVSYELDFSTCVLTISGSGKMESYSKGDAPWYSNKDSITSIVIGDNVSLIGDHAFEGLTILESITIPDSVETIGASAFADCIKLATVRLGRSVESLDMSAFNGCSSLASYAVSRDNGTYSSIGGVLFSKDGTALIQYPVAKADASYEIPAAVRTIGSSAFKGCASLASITVPDSVETVEKGAFDMAFYDPAGETELDLTVENLAGSTFGKVDGKFVKLTEFGKCGESVTYELDHSSGVLAINGSGKMNSYSDGEAPWFAHRVSIKSVEIADSVTSIGDHAFEGLTILESITIPDSVETIGASAFADCIKLATVRLGRSVESIDMSAFNGCSSLASYAVSGDNGTYSSIGGVLFSKDGTVLIQYPVAKADASYEIPAAVRTIAASAFRGCASLSSITIPDSVETVEEGAFDMVFYDPAGENVLEPTVENLAGSSFDNKDGKWIKQASVPPVEPDKLSGECGENVSYELDFSTCVLTISGSGKMESYSKGDAPWYSNKDSITSIVIGDNVSSIGDFAFEGCSHLATVKLGKSVESLDMSAFEDCTSLASYVVSDGNSTYCSIDGVLFSKDGTALIQYPVAKADASYEIPAAVRTIGSSAFKGCASLSSITIPDSVETVEEGAFDMVFYDPAGENVLEPTVENLAGSSFDNKDGKWIKQASVPPVEPDKLSGECGENVSYELDFSTCVLTISGSGKMESYSKGDAPWYSNKDSITSIVIGDNVSSIGDFAFEGCSHLATVKLGKSVESLDMSAFEDCTSLASYVVSDGNSTYCSIDGVLFSKDGTALIQYPVAKADASYEIPAAVRTIGSSAFKGCASLSSITIPDSVETVEEGAFDMVFYDPAGENVLEPTVENLAGSSFDNKDGKWIKQASVPPVEPDKLSGECGENVSYELDFSTCVLTISGSGKMESYSKGDAPWYSNKDSITSIVIGDNVSSIGDFAFEGCSHLATVKLGKSVESLDMSAFEDCTSLASYVVSDGNSTYCSIDSVLFSKDGSVLIQYPVAKADASYEIPEAVRTIGSSAFRGCVSLASITIPDSVETVEEGAFDMVFYDPAGENVLEPTVENLAGSSFDNKDGKWIKQASVPPVEPDKLSGECGENVSYELDFSTCVLTISGSGKMESYSKGDAPWYSNKDSITSIVIGDNVSSIGDFAFEGCSHLATVKLGKSVESLDMSAFEDCTSLASYVVSDGNSTYCSIDGVLFSKDGTALIQYPVAKADASYEIPAAVRTIGSSAFKGCASLSSITIPDSVETVEEGAFDMVFYDPAGENVLEPTVENLAGSSFDNKDGKWIKQASVPPVEPDKLSGECGENVSYELDFSTCVLTISGSGKMESYSKGDAPWYSNKDSITSIVIGDNVSSIGDFAFEGCSHLATVKLGKSVESLDMSAFEDCTSLASYVVSDGNSTYCSIDSVLFSKDGSVLIQYPVAKADASYEIPEAVRTIGSSAFRGCVSLASITIPDSVETVEEGAFDMAFYDPAGETELDQTVENLAGSTFGKVDGKFVKQTEFGKCGESVTYELDHSSGALVIGGSGVMKSYSDGEAPWFAHKDSIRSIEIADSVTSIGDHAFEGLTILESIAIPDSVETIGASAFADCVRLATVRLGRSVESLDMSAFNGCSSLASYAVSGDNGTYSSVGGVLFSKDKSVLIQYPVAKADASYEIPEAVRAIGSSAFRGCVSLASITIPDSVETVEEGAFDMAFYDPAGETELDQTVENLAGSTFGKVDGKFVKLTEFGKCGESVTYELDHSSGVLAISGFGKMNSYSDGEAPWFAHRVSIKSVEIADSVTSIGDHAFEGLTILESITIPDSVETIGASAFAVCIKLATVRLGRSVESLDMSAFNGCSSLASYAVSGDNGTYSSVGGVLFSKDKSVLIQYPVAKADASYEIPEAVRAIGSSAFRGCVSLASITIPDSVETIGASAFADCVRLATVRLGRSVESLDISAFEGCISLASYAVSGDNGTYSSVGGVLFSKDGSVLIQYPVAKADASYEIPEAVRTIGSSAFRGCVSLASITIPDSVETVEEGAFDMAFYDPAGETELDQTVENLAGSTFGKVDGKFVKLTEFGKCGESVTYELDHSSGVLAISGSGKMNSYSDGEAPWFAHRVSIKSVEIADSVTSIGDHAFEGLTILESITIPDSVETIGASAFADCIKLATVRLGRSVESLDMSAFNGCSSLASYAVSGDNGTYSSVGGVLFSKDGSVLIQYPVAKADASYEIPEAVRTIGSSAFRGCVSLASITVPDSVETVEEGAFDMVFYDPAGENVLEPTVENLAGSTFGKVDGKFVKQTEFGKCGESVTYELDHSSGVLAISGSGKMNSYSDGEAPWFAHRVSIKSVEIADSVTSIGDHAFEGLTILESITIPDSVETIGASAFADCIKLATVRLGRSVESLDMSAFNGCSSLASYAVSGDNGTYSSVGGVLFSKDGSVLIQYPVAKADASYEIPEAVRTIGSSAFRGCVSLASITVPDSVETVEEGAFDMVFYDPAGENVLEPTVENLAGSTFGKVDGKFVKQTEFGKCGESVTYELDHSSGVLAISGSGKMNSYSDGEAPWFAHRVSIKSVEIADSVTSIGDHAFEGLTILESITIPDSVETIGASAFADCIKLATVRLGRSVESLDMSAFNGCSSLASYAVSGDNGTYSSIGGVLFSKDGTALIQYPVAKADASYEIPVAVRTIGSSAFRGCVSLSSITVPDSVETVEEGAFDMAFYDPAGETELDQTVENLAGSTFGKVDGKFVKQTEFGKCGESVTYELDHSSGVLAISGSGKMKSYYDGEAPWFSHRVSIKSVEIADSVTSIGDHAFEGLTILESITIPDSVETIGASAFADCIKLATVRLGRSVESIDMSAFNGCSSLASYAVSGDNGTYSSIGGVLFSKDGTALIQYPVAKADASYEIPVAVRTIGSSAFRGCVSLASITVPDSVETVEEGAFDMVFYDPAGENVLEPTVENLAGSSFYNKDGKWSKHSSASAPSDSGSSDRSTMIYLGIAMVVVIALLVAVVVVKKRHA